MTSPFTMKGKFFLFFLNSIVHKITNIRVNWKNGKLTLITCPHLDIRVSLSLALGSITYGWKSTPHVIQSLLNLKLHLLQYIFLLPQFMNMLEVITEVWPVIKLLWTFHASHWFKVFQIWITFINTRSLTSTLFCILLFTF